MKPAGFGFRSGEPSRSASGALTCFSKMLVRFYLFITEKSQIYYDHIRNISTHPMARLLTGAQFIIRMFSM